MDVLEPLPDPLLVDGLLCDGVLTSESREEVAARVMARMNATEEHRGQSHQVRSIIQMQARTMAAAVRGFRAYRPFSFQW